MRLFLNKLEFICVCLIINIYITFSANYPFPHNVTYPYGIKPNNYSQDQMNTFVQTAFNSWRSTYLTSNGCPSGMKRIQAGSAQNYETYSEGIGYGLLILVLMDNSTNNTQADFDAVFRYYKNYNDGRNLMHWKIDASGNVAGQNAATDGDEDVALALLFADKQWGSSGSINYLQEAKTIINALMTHCVESGSYVLKPGDAFGGSHQTNPSYYAPSWYKIFYNVMNDSKWLQVINRCYSTINYFYTTYNTALVANWCKADGSRMDSQYRWWNNDYDYTYDACRVPWRIGMDYIWYGTQHWQNTKNFLLKITSWIKSKTNNLPSAIVDGYDLNGNILGQYNNAAFVGPFAVAAMCDSTQQQWLNSLFEQLKNFSTGGAWGYYSDHLRLLTMLVVSGNFPNLLETATPPQNYTLSVNISPQNSGSVTLNPVGGSYTAGTQVTITATANTGYTFSNWSGDVSGTQNPITVTMNSNKNVTAHFIQQQQVYYNVNVSVNPNGGGSVTISPSGGNYLAGTQVTLTALPNTGYVFSNWSGDITTTANPATLIVNSNKNIVANFSVVQKPVYNLLIYVYPQNSGTVSVSPVGSQFEEGTNIILTALPNSGYSFSEWSGDVQGSISEVSLLMDSHKTVVATFIQQNSAVLPTVVIENIFNNSDVYGIVNIETTISSGKGVQKVEFYVDDLLVHTDIDFPYSYSWDTSNFSLGSHIISVVAYDLEGNFNTKTLSVNVVDFPAKVNEKNIHYVSLNNAGEKRVDFKKICNFVIFDYKGKILKAEKGSFWDCKDSNGKLVNIGLYFFKIEIENTKEFGKIVILK
ncbi:MAG: glycosyl hydrolase family 8 [Endomicrobia bacterium]|nr:glycosyl hydrolase family 8 [Endomicrobiia bacterium]